MLQSTSAVNVAYCVAIYVANVLLPFKWMEVYPGLSVSTNQNYCFMTKFNDLRNDCNNFSVDGGIPRKMDSTPHHARSVTFLAQLGFLGVHGCPT